MEELVIALLCFVSLACVAGAFSQCYSGTLLQRIGMALIAFWAMWRAGLIIQEGDVHPSMALGALGMAVFAAGTMIKTWLWRYRK
jgi:hypothetical protein